MNGVKYGPHEKKRRDNIDKEIQIAIIRPNKPNKKTIVIYNNDKSFKVISQQKYINQDKK